MTSTPETTASHTLSSPCSSSSSLSLVSLSDIIITPPEQRPFNPLPDALRKLVRDCVVGIRSGETVRSEEERDEDFISDEIRRRIIVRDWSYKLDGQKVLPRPPPRLGKSPDGRYIWGASVLDFYGLPYQIDGSRLPARGSGNVVEPTETLQQTKTYVDAIAWAEKENTPHIIPVYSVAQLLREQEEHIREGRIGKPWGSGEWEGVTNTTKGTLHNATPSPPPWPIEPFSYTPPNLAETLPLHLLPETLFVHTVPRLILEHLPHLEEDEAVQTYEYKLNLTTVGEEKRELELDNQRREQESLEAKDGDSPYGFMIPHGPDVPPGPVEPPIFVVLPRPPPRHPAGIAHLYISSNLHAGSGNHSEVYRAELDLPRDTLMPEVLCRQCVLDNVQEKIVQEDGENGERKADVWKEKSGVLKRERTDEATRTGIVGTEKVNEHSFQFTVEEPGDWQTSYEGKLRYIHADVEYQNPSRGRTYCEHVRNHESGSSATHPSTARVRVIAKLTNMDRYHMEQEANNYQMFPDHFFQHWNGYHLIPGLKDLVPVSAIVPQFFGYYKPKNSGNRGFMSNILLLEDCGRAIDSTGYIRLSYDDESERAALILRMNDAGWGHGSIAERNLAVQPGPLWKHPSERGKVGGGTGIDSSYSFRLIDFGRSVDLTKVRDRERLKRQDRGQITAINRYTLGQV